MIVNDLQEAGGRHTLEDMSSYRPRVTPADRFTYRAHTVHVTPELTAGPTLRAVLRDLEGSWSPKGKSPDGRAYAAYERAIRAANEERYREMGDPLQEPAPSCTTHFNVVDDNGLMVSVTQTLLSIFGARRMLPHSGIIMNNGVMWMDPEVGRPNSIAPGKRCLSNMCPTILEASDGTSYALGAAGGRKILPAIAQLSSFVLDYGMNSEEAIQCPRIDASLPDCTIVDMRLKGCCLTEFLNKTSQSVFAPRGVYPTPFAIPAITSRRGRTLLACTEPMSPWGTSVSAG